MGMRVASMTVPCQRPGRSFLAPASQLLASDRRPKVGLESAGLRRPAAAWSRYDGPSRSQRSGFSRTGSPRYKPARPASCCRCRQLPAVLPSAEFHARYTTHPWGWVHPFGSPCMIGWVGSVTVTVIGAFGPWFSGTQSPSPSAIPLPRIWSDPCPSSSDRSAARNAP